MKAIQLDKEVLLTLYSGCEESIAEVFAEFINGYAELKLSLFAAFDSGNITSMKKLLHFHGPSFMYLGIPSVTEMFKELELKCKQEGNVFSVSVDFKALMQAVDESWMEVVKEANCLRKAV
jgi:hypothetical protein